MEKNRNLFEIVWTGSKTKTISGKFILQMRRYGIKCPNDLQSEKNVLFNITVWESFILSPSFGKKKTHKLTQILANI